MSEDLKKYFEELKKIKSQNKNDLTPKYYHRAFNIKTMDDLKLIVKNFGEESTERKKIRIRWETKNQAIIQCKNSWATLSMIVNIRGWKEEDIKYIQEVTKVQDK